MTMVLKPTCSLLLFEYPVSLSVGAAISTNGSFYLKLTFLLSVNVVINPLE